MYGWRPGMRWMMTAWLALGWLAGAAATPTAQGELQVLPAPGKMVINGRADDWDLSGGLFMCRNVEQEVNTHATWVHAMWDADNVYLLFRFTDATPLDNPYPVSDDGNAAWKGDSVQFRFVSGDGTVVHSTAWRDRNGRQRLDLSYGQGFDQGHVDNALTQGARMAFSRYADGKGYVQEIALPWKLLGAHQGAPKAGDEWSCTMQANFTAPGGQTVYLLNVFNLQTNWKAPGIFARPPCWGRAVFLDKGRLTPPPPVRLENKQEYAVTLKDNVPLIDWRGLVEQAPPNLAVEFRSVDATQTAAIQALIQQLGAATATERKAAQTKLLALGAATSEELQRHLDDPDLEVRLAVKDLFAQIGGLVPVTNADDAPAAPAEQPATPY